MVKKDLCIVHIGMPKTGSSTLQEAFFNGIADTRVAYGSLPHPNQSGWLYSLFTKQHQDYHFLHGLNLSGPEDLNNFIHETRKSLVGGFSRKKNSIELLSGEDLFHLDIEGIQGLRIFLEGYFEKTLIVAYVRPFKSFIESVFQQLVKYHGCGSFSFNGFYHPFKNFKRYDDVFGAENVLLWKFLPASFPEGDIVLDFCNRLQLQPMRAKNKVVNEAISREAVSILFCYHYHQNGKTDFGPHQAKVNHLLVEALRGIGSEKFRFSRALVRRVVEEFRDDYEWMSQRLEGFDSETEADGADDGFGSAEELLDYSTGCIGDLLGLVDTREMNFALVNHPQTVARLVDLLAVQLHRKDMPTGKP